jgi:hypothetical protein
MHGMWVSGRPAVAGTNNAPEHKEMMMGALQEALKLHTTREAQEQTLREELKAGLVEEAEDLVADGGPVAVTQHGETYYPLRAVLVALDYRDPATLQEAWDAVFGKQGPLPLYLCPTEDGHYAAMVAETVVLEQLIELTDEYDTAMMAVRDRFEWDRAIERGE